MRDLSYGLLFIAGMISYAQAAWQYDPQMVCEKQTQVPYEICLIQVESVHSGAGW